jgi:hypothetical protein
MTSHEALCFLNTGAADAEIQLWIYFTDKKPQGPYLFTVPAERSFHLRMNDLKSPAPVPKGTEYSCYLQASQPVVVQHTRLDSRQAANALMTTIAYGE